MLNSLVFIKKVSLVLGAAGISVLVGYPALAQSPSQNSSQEFRESREIMMSNEGMAILCKVTPINSRCEGSPYYTGASTIAPGETSEPSPSNTTAPTENLPSESPVPSAPADGMAPGEMAPGEMAPGGMAPGEMAPDSGTTAPTENLPSESPVPSAPAGK